MRRIVSDRLWAVGAGAILLSMGNYRGRTSSRQRGPARRRNRHREGRAEAYSTPWFVREVGGAPMWLLMLILLIIAGVGVLYAVVR